MTVRKNVDVLIVGGGSTGLTASMLLSSYGVSSFLVSKYPQTSRLPKASLLAIKTMEIFRELGLEDAIRERATPPKYMRYTGMYAGLAGPSEDYNRPIVRLGYWDQAGEDPDWRAASTVSQANLMQSELEPLMRARAEELAPGCVAFHQNFQSFEETDDGILATIEDRDTGEPYQVVARYLLGCDGGRVLGAQLGVEMEGHLNVATNISVHFSADLSHCYRDSEALLTTIFNPDVGVPCALVTVGPRRWGSKSTEWVSHMLSFPGDRLLLDNDEAVSMMRRCLGLQDVPLEIHVVNHWPLDAVVASRYRTGRAFLLGDAAHRMPPAGGHGLNSAVQDAYNLCWKLASVLNGGAAESLLDTYESERRLLAQHVVATAFKSYQGNKDFALAVGLSPQNTPEVNWANVRTIWDNGPEGEAARERVKRVVPKILPNANPLNLNFGYTYHDGAVVAQGSTEPYLPDPLGTFQPSTRPGCSLPDRWVANLGGLCALGDLVGQGRFVLIAGEDGRDWVDAARRVAKERRIGLDAFTVGDGGADWLDARNAWIRVREHGRSGAILVRPDRFVAWRAMQGSVDPAADLHAAFERLLDLRPPQKLRNQKLQKLREDLVQ